MTNIFNGLDVKAPFYIKIIFIIILFIGILFQILKNIFKKNKEKS
jgi:hypothetical protein